MADEPRRSGRATKGQHTKMETPEPATSESKKPKSKGKSLKKSAEPEPEEEQDESDELIRCVCGHQSDEGGRMMVCCDNCNAWQHNDCMGVTEVQAELPDNYLCEQCDPDAHRPLLDAMARGEKPWEEIALKKQAKKKGGKKAKAGRQSLKSEAADAETETPRSSVGTESNKRKHESSDTTSHPAKTRKSDSSAKAAGKLTTTSEPLALVRSIAELSPDARKNVAASLKKKLQPLVKDADTKGRWKIPRGRSVDSESERFAILIEYSLFINHCGEKPDFGGQYKQQLLRILPNIEKNPTLLPQLLNGQLTTDALATMTSDQMASEEHRQKMQEMKEEVEKQSILLQDHDGPRMRRTHKGDEIIDDVSNDFTSESIMSAPVVRRRESELDAQSPTDQNGSGSPTQSPAHGRRDSSTLNRGNIYSHSPTGAQPPRSASNAPVKPPPQFHEDPNIDNLLGDDGRDDAEYEPTDLQPTIWRGNIVMTSHGLSFTLSSRLVAGSDLARRIEQGSIASLSELFPRNLTISGRIESKRADEYLASLSQSPSTDVSVFVLSPSDPEDPPFEHFFRYFHGKDRFAVVDHNTTRSEVRDFYLAPLEAGSQTPQFLGRLHYNDLPPNRPRKLLLAIIVCKWPMTVDGAQGTPSTLVQHGMSPAPPQLQANTPTQNGPGIAGSSAYQPPPPQQQYNMPMHGIPGNPYLPPHQQPQAHYQQQGQYPSYPVPGSKEALALEILGPLANVPVAQQILQQENIQAESLHNLRRIFERHPETQNDMARFTEILTSTAS